MTEKLHTIALQRLLFSNPDAAIQLYRAAGSAMAVYENRHEIRAILPSATDRLQQLLAADWAAEKAWAESEIEWCGKKNVQVLIPSEAAYPQRLHQCVDAPLALFHCGTANLNATHTLSIVGTRKSSPYGRDVIASFMADLARQYPDILVVSGLAYGIDIEAHRAAMKCSLPTVAVLAHGLDTIYPASHRPDAVRMTAHGGLLTEYPKQTPGERQYFLRRNRIVAGLTDATIVVESMSHGGSLVTARIASEYGRMVYAVPGAINRPTSEGCNELIRRQRALMLTSAQDLIQGLGWQHSAIYDSRLRNEGIQTTAFPDLSAEERLIAEALRPSDLSINDLSMRTKLSVATLSSLLFQMEMAGVVRPMPGNMVHLI